MIEIRQADDTLPRCPHCNQDLQTVLFRELRGVLGKRFVYFCQHCRAVLGVSHRKGFWMG